MLEKRTEKIEYIPPYDALKTYEKIIADSAKSFLRSNQGRKEDPLHGPRDAKGGKDPGRHRRGREKGDHRKGDDRGRLA